ncbi:IclR family transcriptional regulator [Burkholderia sp. IMCC1007]|uniref:IclR family transcriptional regulator n=1 Tax=Burkholderia sp. IMCC1007 TaxID=3004104 RepID=UPI0022B58F08|nr:IclR family transcriptional regulator [Burkholderia sp. IMCC1007]
MSEDRRARIGTLEKALAALEAFGPATPDLRIAELAEATGMNRSSAQRVAHTLEKCGYLRRDPVSSALSMTYRNAYMAHTFLSTSNLIDLAVPALVELSAQTHMRADLWVRQGDDVINISRIPSAAHSRAMVPIGERLYALTSAPGMAMLACGPEKSFADCVASLSASQRSDATADERHRWVLALKTAAKAGYVYEPGLNPHDESTISAAVLDADGHSLAAVSISGRFGEKSGNELTTQFVLPVLNTAHALSQLRIQPWARALSRPAEERIATPPISENDADPLFIESVARGLFVLESFSPTRSVMTLTELHRLTGLPVATVQRVVDTLIACGYIEKDPRLKTFRLSVKTLDLLFRFQMSDHTIKAVWPRLVQLRDECGLRCSFCVLAGSEIVHLLHVQSHPHSHFRTAFVGRRLPTLSTSGGLAILSTRSDTELDMMLSSIEVKPTTPFTIMDKSMLRERIMTAREKGYAFTDQQSIPDEVNIAAPVFDSNGCALGAIVVSAPRRDWNVARLESEVAPPLLAYSRSIFN